MPEHPDSPEPERALPIARPVRRRPDPARTRRIVRFVLGAVAIALTAVFVAAFRIHPYEADGTPRTHGTHTQLGMPPCNFAELTGKPCPNCGMTTSFALLVRGDVRAALRANWAGAVICVLWAGLLVWALVGALKGRIVLIPPHRVEAAFTIGVGVVLALALGRWAAVLLSD